MCGRYSLTTPLEAMRQLFGFTGSINLAARYNIAPTQDVPVLRADGSGQTELLLMRWGLIPSWAKDAAIGARMINARIETAAEKPSFRSAFRRRRCIIPSDGFYEWKTRGDGKQPYRICLGDMGVFAFAGLWEGWQDPAGGEVLSCSILTTEASARLQPIHHRMPVILKPDQYPVWLDPAGDPPADIATPFDDDRMQTYPVSRAVNKPVNDSPECFEAIELEAEMPAAPSKSAKKPAQGSLF